MLRIGRPEYQLLIIQLENLQAPWWRTFQRQFESRVHSLHQPPRSFAG